MGLLVGVFFLLAFGYVVGQAAGYALFVKRFGSRELPFAILCMPVFGVVLAWLNLRAVRRLGLPRALLLDVCSMAVVSIALRLAVADDAHTWIRFVLPMWDAGVNNLNNLVVWGAATRLFDVRQAKRLSPVISAGRSIALVVGGFLVPTVVHSVGTTNLYVLQATLFAAGCVVLLVLTRVRHAALAGTVRGADVAAGPPTAARAEDESRYVAAVFGVVFASMLAYVLVRNIFLDRGAARYPVAADYAARIGILNALQGMLTLVSGLAVSSRFLRRFGLRGGLLALPVALTLVYAPLAFLGLGVSAQFTVASAGFVLCGAMMFSIRTPAVQLLYQPLDALARTRAVSKAEGIVEPLALGAAAVVLLLVARAAGLGARGMAFAVLAAAAVLVVLGRRAVDGYRRALDRALSRRWLRGDAIDLADPATSAWVRRAADAGDAPQVVALVGMLEEAGADSTPLLVRMVTHREAEVRAFALTTLLDRRHELDHDLARDMAVGHPSAEVRAAATRLLCRGGELAAGARAAEDPNLDVRAAALAGLLESSVTVAHEVACGTVDRLSCSEDPDDRTVAARALARCTSGAPLDTVTRLAADPDPAVRADAYLAAGRHRAPIDLDELVGALRSRPLHHAAGQALHAYDSDALVPLVRALLATSAADRTFCRRATRVLTHLDAAGATEALRRLLAHPVSGVRDDAARALRTRGEALDDTTLLALVTDEHRRVVDARRDRDALGEPQSAAETLLAASLEDRERATRHRVLALVALRAGAAPADDVARAVDSPDPKLRAYAMESLDTTLPSSLRSLVLPLLGAPAPVGSSDDARRREVLGRLRDGDDAWLARLATIAVTGTDTDTDLKGAAMVPLVERVVFLKRVDAFARLPTETLSHVASVLQETTLRAGTTLFRKGDAGTSMYLVFEGEVRIHDGEFDLDRRGEHAVFGELAVLDAEPRTADATAVTDTLLLRLDQEPLYELMADRPDVLRGFVSNVVATLRDRLADVAALRRELAAVDPARG